jgi:lipopolysaccharide biosynthesis protein
MHKPTVVTIFAHYNAENIIDNACLQNLAGLKAISNQIIFISTSNLPEIEITKIEN